MILDVAEIAVFLGKGSTLTDAESAFLTMIQPMVERAIKSYCGCNLEPQVSYTHYLPEQRRRGANVDIRTWDVRGNNAVAMSAGGVIESQYLYLPERPVRTITSVNVDEGASGGQGADDFAGDNLTAGDDYWLDVLADGISRSGKLVRQTSYWPATPRSVKVVYTAGYSQAELTYDATNRTAGIAADIKMAALIAIQNAFSQRGTDGGEVKSEKLGDYAVTYAIEQASELPKRAKKYLRPYVRYSRFM